MNKVSSRNWCIQVGAKLQECLVNILQLQNYFLNLAAIPFVWIGKWKVAWMIKLSSADWKKIKTKQSVAGDATVIDTQSILFKVDIFYILVIQLHRLILLILKLIIISRNLPYILDQILFLCQNNIAFFYNW